ncbi:MAG: hypothetical protein HPY44_06670 [Armatimonadetes bacterium]|nr:hypothetical protein [Armatimonadota bacterium]
MSDRPPDVTACELPLALERLTRGGWTVAQVIETGPPSAGPGQGVARVVRQRLTDGGSLQLVVAYPQYGQPKDR